MKLLIPYLLLSSFALTHLAADEKFVVTAEYDRINKAKFKKTDSERGHHLTYSNAAILAKYKHKLDNDRGLSFGIGYADTRYHFTHHPRHTSFHEKNFHNVILHVGAKTKELERWVWKADIDAQINTEHFALQRYTFFTGEVYGRYSWHQNRNLYAGILAFTGMRYSRALPIIGFDYTFNDKWMLKAIFPIDMALIYSFNKQLSFDAAIRYFLDRQRFNDHDTYRRGYVAYRNWGAEAGLNYAFNEFARIKLHVGDAFAGRMRISNHKDRHRKHLKLDSSVYYGLEATIAF